eukprot:831376-Amphidinium_carterae.1
MPSFHFVLCPALPTWASKAKGCIEIGWQYACFNVPGRPIGMERLFVAHSRASAECLSEAQNESTALIIRYIGFCLQRHRYVSATQLHLSDTFATSPVQIRSHDRTKRLLARASERDRL